MTHTDIIKRHGDRAVAQAAGTNERRVRAWRERNSIPGWYWPALAEAGIAALDELAVAASSKAAA